MFTIDDVVTWYMKGRVGKAQKHRQEQTGTVEQKALAEALRQRRNRAVDEIVAKAVACQCPKFN